MQLSRTSSHKPGTNLSDFYFNLLLHGIQDDFVISFRKKKLFEVVEVMENDFQEMH